MLRFHFGGGEWTFPLLFVDSEFCVVFERYSTTLADEDFWSSLSEGELVCDVMHSGEVRFQGAALCEAFLALVTGERLDSSMRSDVALEVKCVIETFTASGAVVALEWSVRLHVPVKEPGVTI